MSLLQAGFGSSGDDYTIDDSLRFRASATAYLSRTPATAGNRKTWTWSGWVKRGNLGTAGYKYFWSLNQSSGIRALLGFTNADTLRLETNSSGSSWDSNLTTSAVYRDCSAWYHVITVVCRYYTSLLLANRVKFYVNGVQETSFSY
jgi:hypothetical protein